VGYNGFQIRIRELNIIDSPEDKVISEPIASDFLIQNNILNKMKDEFSKAVSTINNAIQTQRPILIKHHNDADGYSGALALEEAILGVMKNDTHFNKWNLFSRVPSTTPFYDYFDATIDISNAISKGKRFGNAKPLLIIVDNGSTESDEIGINLVKGFGFEIVVIDHHTPINNEKIDVHINPHLVGGDSNLTAGMLCVELAKKINPQFDSYQYACISAIGDRSNISDYFKFVDIPINKLKKMAIVIDFQAKFLRRMEARGLMQELLSLDKEHLDIIFNEVEKRLKQQVNLISMNFDKELINNTNFLTLDYNKVKLFRDFPSIGTNAGLLINEFGGSNSITAVYGEGIIVIRSSNNNFDFNALLAKIKENPKYGARGGGHKKAGTIIFVGTNLNDILRETKEYISTPPIKHTKTGLE